MNLAKTIDALNGRSASMTAVQAVADLSAYIAENPTLLPCVLTQYPFDKGSWDNKAQVIAAQSDHVLEHYAAGVLDWLQDLNWPGSMRLFERLAAVRKGRLDAAIAECIQFAESLNDEEWVCFLRELQAFRSKI